MNDADTPVGKRANTTHHLRHLTSGWWCIKAERMLWNPLYTDGGIVRGEEKFLCTMQDPEHEGVTMVVILQHPLHFGGGRVRVELKR